MTRTARTSRRLLVPGVTVAGIAVAVTSLLGPTAQAGETSSSTCAATYEGSGSCFDPTDGRWVSASRALYDDSGNTLTAYDDATDGRSAVVKYWPKGNPGAVKKLWNHTGKGSKKSISLSAAENSKWVIQACLGEWSSTPANRRVTSCAAHSKVVYI